MQLLPPSPSRRSVLMGRGFCYEEYIDNLYFFIVRVHKNGSSTLLLKHVLRMVYFNRRSIRQMDRERFEWFGLVDVSNLIGRHREVILNPARNMPPFTFYPPLPR